MLEIISYATLFLWLLGLLAIAGIHAELKNIRKLLERKTVDKQPPDTV